MKELEKKIINEVLHVVHSPEHSLSKLREIVAQTLKEAYELGSEHQEAVDRLNDEL